jgi:hypothetical protein
MTMLRTHSVSKTHFRWNELYPVLCLIFLATSPVIFLGEGNRNLGLIALMFVAPLFILRRTLEADGYLLGFAFSIVIFPALVHSGGTRWSTIFYTLMFCGFFISYDGMLRRRMLRLAVFVKIIRYLIIAYTVVLIIQQLCVLVGLPIFNLSNYDPSNRWKLNSLSAEPSHSARIVGLLMLSYSLGMGLLGGADRNLKVSQRQNIGLWLCFFWTMITMLSAAAVAMMVIVLLTNAQGKSLRSYTLGFLLAIFAMFLLPGELTERIFAMSSAFLTLDYETVLNADHSGGMRLAPMLVLLDKIEVFSISGLFGNGVDSVSLFMSDYIWGLTEGTTGGGLLALWYEYGLIAFLFFVFFTLKTTSALKSPVNFLVWFILIFIAGVNNQMVWLAIILLHTLNFYRQHMKLIASSEDLRGTISQ